MNSCTSCHQNLKVSSTWLTVFLNIFGPQKVKWNFLPAKEPKKRFLKKREFPSDFWASFHLTHSIFLSLSLTLPLLIFNLTFKQQWKGKTSSIEQKEEKNYFFMLEIFSSFFLMKFSWIFHHFGGFLRGSWGSLGFKIAPEK